MKRNYCLVFVKECGHGKLKNSVLRVLYRKQNRFYIDHMVTDRNMMNVLQAYYWYFIIWLYGKNSQKLFAYKKTGGSVLVQKMY